MSTYTHPEDGIKYPSVTTILGSSQDQGWLKPWALGVAAEYAAENRELLASLPAAEAEEIVKVGAGKRMEVKAAFGSHLHGIVEALLKDGPLPLLPDFLEGRQIDGVDAAESVNLFIDGFLYFVEDFDPTWYAAEMTVFNRGQGYAGTLDAIADIGGQRLVVDVKSGKHSSVTWLEQVAAYRRASECLLPMGQIMPMPATDGTAILRVNPMFERGYLFLTVPDAKEGAAWETFASALHTYKTRRDRGGFLGVPTPAPGDRGLISHTPLPTAVVSALAGAGLTTLRQLTAAEPEAIRKIKRVGPKAFEAIMAVRAGV